MSAAALSAAALAAALLAAVASGGAAGASGGVENELVRSAAVDGGSVVGSVVGGGRGGPADAAVRDLEVMRSPSEGFFFAEGAGVLTKAELGRGIAWTDEDRGRRNGRAGPETAKAHCGVHFIILKEKKNDTDKD